MKHNDKNISSDSPNDQELFAQLKVPYKQDKSAIWEQLSSKIEEESPKTKVRSLLWPKLAAACVVLGIGIASVLKFYTTNITCPQGQQLAHTLPDGSIVKLNAESSLSYAPYWWSFDRTVELEGEAFFEVEKGQQFTVSSNLGNTKVLGTSFNIFARAGHYEVFCATGKVQVEAKKSGKIIQLTPDQFAKLESQNNLVKLENIDAQSTLAWTQNKLNFKATELTKVLQTLERQYAVKIDLSNKITEKHIYTANYNKPTTIEEALELICLSFSLKFEKTTDNHYKIEPVD
ncbi:MAG: FecR family protein [Aureispira sp.]|nr:FecR family protein [Aureispira sp.]